MTDAKVMTLTLHRQPSFEETTLGTLFVDGVKECDTLEDLVRPPGEKVYGKTAIPPGRYQVRVTLSPRFGVQMPELLEVPGFSGVRIHPLNTAAETEGCIGVGTVADARTIVRSRAAYDALLPKIERACAEGECWIDIRSAG